MKIANSPGGIAPALDIHEVNAGLFSSDVFVV
jgi:hypothetical protein